MSGSELTEVARALQVVFGDPAADDAADGGSDGDLVSLGLCGVSGVARLFEG